MLLGELSLRFLVGGVVVSVFSVLGDLFKPKTFAGVFGAAPSVGIATLALTFASKGGTYGATEGRSMTLGAIAMLAYCLVCAWVVKLEKVPPWVGAGLVWTVWLGLALALERAVLR